MELEMLESTADTAVDTEVTTDVDLSAFDDGWDDDPMPAANDVDAEAETVEETEADQQEESKAEAEQDEKPAEQTEPEQEKAAESQGADQRMTVKHLDTVRELDWSKDKDEIKTLVQKGMDYDRKSQKLSDYEKFLKELAGPQNLSIDQLIDSTRARMLKAMEAKKGNEISETDALLTVQKQRMDEAEAQEAEAKTQKQSAEDAAKEKSKESFNRFIAAYPDVKGETIPKSVWDEFAKSGDLVAAYAKFEKKQLEEEIKALKQNKKNSERSIGSVRSSGTTKTRDAFDEGWDDID